ncbi:MAG: RepB family plasmid replication initiator protein [Cetobacterium sp.]|uniref:RepB family plasmid replication initiator protein n=1 Tax=Cetobacterium sp. TaxID=2071632 RepID=UPI003F3A31BE
MSDIIKYHNDVNNLRLGKFTDKETDIFFSIMFKSMNTTGNVVINFSELKNLIEGHRSEQRLINNVRRLNLKLKTLVDEVRDKDGNYIAFSLFGDITTKPKERIIEIKIDDRFRNLINNLMGKFTEFDLKDLISLKSVYSKILFRLLKQWETKKEREIQINEFRELLAIPPKYRLSEIDKFVLAPIMLELPRYFPNLKLEKIKTGKRVTSLKFTWSRKIEKIELKKTDDVIDIITISEELNQVIEKAKKNRFIEKLLTIDNIEILTQMFQENDLVKGLLWAYREVSQDVSSLNYLIKTIRTGIEKKEKKLIVKKSEDKQESIFDKTFQEIPLDLKEDEVENEKQEIENSIIKQKVTMDQYEELYKKYLEENQTEHNPYVRKSFELYSKIRCEIVEDEEDIKIEIIEDTYNHYLTEEMDRLAVITEISDNDLLNKMAKSILDKKYKVVPFEFSNPIHMGELDEAIKRDCTMEARLRYTERDHLNYLKNNEEAINFADLDRNLLLSKSGKMLTGGALEARLEKIAKDLKKVIFYKNKIIGNMWETY